MRLLPLSLILSLPALISSCTQPHRSARTLRDQGFTDVRITGFARRLCAENEDFATGFTARLEGERVSGAVCHEPFEDDVVRFKRR